MSLIDKIKGTFTDVNEPFNYGYIEQINDILGNEDMPSVFVLPPVSTTMINKWQRGRFVLNAYFVDGSDYENSEETKEGIIEGCRNRAAKWLYAIHHGIVFDIIGEPTMTRVDFELNALVVGVRVTVTLQWFTEKYC